MRIKLGVSKRPDGVKYKYSDIPKHGTDWMDVEEYLPFDFDLVTMKMDNGRQMNGWHASMRWDGLNFDKKKHKVVNWKRNLFEYA